MKIFLIKIANWLDACWPSLLELGLFAIAWWFIYVAKTGNFPDWLIQLLMG